MAENVPPGSSGKGTAEEETGPRGLPYYEKLRRDLRDTLTKKRILDKNMANLEDQIFRHETSYLEETSIAGNIIKGFDNYIKSSTISATASGGGGGTISGSAAGGAGAGRRKAVINDADRVFSRSSVGYMRDSDSPSSATSTPNHAGTPTGSFAAGPDREKKKKKVMIPDESETDGRANKRQKHSFGGGRKGYDE